MPNSNIILNAQGKSAIIAMKYTLYLNKIVLSSGKETQHL